MRCISRQRISPVTALPHIGGQPGDRVPQQPAHPGVIFDNQNCHGSLEVRLMRYLSVNVAVALFFSEPETPVKVIV